MIDFIPAILVFIIEVFLFIRWIRSRRLKDGRDARLCLYGFLLGQAYIIFETTRVSRTGPPADGSAEQRLLMLRFFLGASLGGLFTIIGILYLSFGAFTGPKEE